MAFKYAKDQPPGFTNRVKKVAVIGGGGHIGRHLLEQVMKKGTFDVTCISRPSSNSKLADGVKVVRADYDDDAALVNALRGQQALIISMAVMAPRDTIIKLSRAAAEAGVTYILPNWYGHDSENDRLCEDSMLAATRDATVAEITRLGVSYYILLNCNFWYEFSLGGGPDRFGFDFPQRKFTWLDKGDVPINTSTWPQCGRAVANLLSLPELPVDEKDKTTTLSHFRNGSVYISSFRLTQRDMFDSVKRVTHTTDANWTIDRDSSKKRWEEGTAAVKEGNFGAFTKMLYSRMFFPTGDADYESRRGLDNKTLGLPVEDLDEWTAEAVRMGEAGEVVNRH